MPTRYHVLQRSTSRTLFESLLRDREKGGGEYIDTPLVLTQMINCKFLTAKVLF